MQITANEWSVKCARGQGQRINGKRYIYVPCGDPHGALGKWVEVELVG